MQLNNRTELLLLSSAIMLEVLASCDNILTGECQPFDFNRIDTSKVIFYDSYQFVTTNDTLHYPIVELYASNANHGFYGSCYPRLEINFGRKGGINNLYYCFSYGWQGDKYSTTELSLGILASKCALSCDSTKFALEGDILLNDFNHGESSDSSMRIEYAKYRSMKLMEFGTKDGRIWKLHEVGNPISIRNGKIDL
jgi:hypothetical protein